MNHKTIKYELQNILSGTSGDSYDTAIQAIAHHLRGGERTSPTSEEKFKNKPKETAKLVAYARAHNLFLMTYRKKITCRKVRSRKYLSQGMTP